MHSISMIISEFITRLEKRSLQLRLPFVSWKKASRFFLHCWNLPSKKSPNFSCPMGMGIQKCVNLLTQRRKTNTTLYDCVQIPLESRVTGNSHTFLDVEFVSQIKRGSVLTKAFLNFETKNDTSQKILDFAAFLKTLQSGASLSKVSWVLTK